MLNVRITMSDQGFPLLCGVYILSFGDSPLVDRVGEERDCLRDHIYLASFSGKCPEVADSSPTLLEEQWGFPGEVELLSTRRTGRPQRPPGSLPGLATQSARAVPSKLSTAPLLSILLGGMYVGMSF